MSIGLDQPTSDGGNGKKQVQGIPLSIHIHVDATHPTTDSPSALTSVVQSKDSWYILICRYYDLFSTRQNNASHSDEWFDYA